MGESEMEKKEDKVISMSEFNNGKPEIPGPDRVRQSLDMLKASLKMNLEFEGIKAKLLKARYDALVSEGFNKEQALELCKQI
jgi:fatty acid/phospholipid biosynthesis enzyme